MTIANRADRSQTQLAGVAGRGLGDDVEAPERALIDDTQLDSGLATDVETAALFTADQIVFKAVTGVDGDPGPTDMTVTGIAVGDTLLAVFGGDGIAHDLSKFTIGTNKLTLTGLDLGAFDYIVVYIDASA